jgi:hypothetical protein
MGEAAEVFARGEEEHAIESRFASPNRRERRAPHRYDVGASAIDALPILLVRVTRA